MSAVHMVRTQDASSVGGWRRAAVVAAGRRWSSGLRELVGLVAALDDSGEWALDGVRTCAHWVAGALDVEVCTAREWLRIGHGLARLPLIDAAFADGRLSYSKVRALTRVADADNEAELCELAQRVPAGRLPHALAAWLLRHETPDETEARHHATRSLSWRVECDGMVSGTFRLPAAQAAVVTAAVDTAVVRRRPRHRGTEPAKFAEGGMGASADASMPPKVVGWPTVAQQRADALVDIISAGGTRVSTEVVVHVRGDGCTLDDGTPIADSVVERIAPESFLRVLLHDARSRPINASGRQRHPTTRQRRVVHERDGACVACGSTEFLEYDHDPAYEYSRHTIVDELKLRCWLCHYGRHRNERESP